MQIAGIAPQQLGMRVRRPEVVQRQINVMLEVSRTWENGTRTSNAMVWSAGALGIIATAVGAILPVLVSVWQNQAGIRVDQAGFVAATELFSQVVGTGIFLWTSRKQTMRVLAVAGLLIMVIGNLATAASVDFNSLILSRVVGGTGGGLIRALCMMCLAKAISPGRAFAIYAAAQVSLAAVTTATIPYFIDALGPRAPFAAFSIVSILGFALCPFLPRGTSPGVRDDHRGLTSTPLAAIIAIVALCVYFVGQGALWTYLAPIGASQSISAAGVSRALTFLNIAGLAGALGVGALAHRMNPRVVLSALLTTETLSIVGLFNVHSSGLFTACAGVFYFSWCASFPFQFTLIAKSDASGRASAVVPAADGLGLAGGAALAGLALPTLGLNSTGWICGAASVVGIMLYMASASLSKMSTSFVRQPVADATTREG